MRSPESDYERVERAIRFLESRAEDQPSLERVAAHAGLSPFHFQRLFKRWAGISPKRFLQALTAEHAKERLREAASVLDTAYDVGLSGPGRLHDLLVSVDAVTPGDVKRGGAGLAIRHGTCDTPYGPAHVGLTERGVCSLAFGSRAHERARLEHDWPGARLVRDDAAAANLIGRVFSTPPAVAAPILLLLKGTNLQVKVWTALLRIPAGEVVSYGGLARALGRPNAARAVANAVGANRIAYLIPCHRVLRGTGAVGGYRWGIARKKAMLGRELAAHPSVRLV